MTGLEFKQVAHGEQTTVLRSIFGCQHGSQGKSPAVVRIVGDGNTVGGAVPGDAVDARHFITANAVYAYLVGGNVPAAFYRTVGLGDRACLPSGDTVHLGCQFLCQGDGSAAGVIQLMDMMNLFHAGRVVLKLVHDTGQITVDSSEDGHSQTEVTAPEERLSFLLAHALYLFSMLGNPSSAAAHHLDVMGKGTQVIAIGSLRSSKLDGNIGRAECFAVKVVRIVHIDDTYYLVPAAYRYLLYHAAHLAVSYQCYLHVSVFISFVQK